MARRFGIAGVAVLDGRYRVDVHFSTFDSLLSERPVLLRGTIEMSPSGAHRVCGCPVSCRVLQSKNLLSNTYSSTRALEYVCRDDLLQCRDIQCLLITASKPTWQRTVICRAQYRTDEPRSKTYKTRYRNWSLPNPKSRPFTQSVSYTRVRSYCGSMTFPSQSRETSPSWTRSRRHSLHLQCLHPLSTAFAFFYFKVTMNTSTF